MDPLANLPYRQLPLKTKLRLILEMGGNSFANISTFIVPMILTSISLSYLSTYQLKSAFFLGTMCEWGIIYGLIISMNQGANILMSQAFGAKNYRACGIYFQRSLVLLAIILALLLVMMLSTSGVTADIPRLRSWDIEISYISISFFACIGGACFDSMKSFITSQKVFYPVLIIQLASIPLHALFAYLLMGQFQLGIQGAAYCHIIIEWSCAAVTFLYIKRSNKFSETWIPWSRKVFDESGLWQQFKFSAPIIALSYCTWLYLLVFYYLTYLEVEDISRMRINVQVGLGVSMTMTTYIANSIGKQAITEAKAYFYTGMIVLLVFCAGLFPLIFPSPGSWNLALLNYGHDDGYGYDPFYSMLAIYCYSGLWLESVLNGQIGLLKAIGKQEIGYFIYLLISYPIGGLFILLFTSIQNGFIISYGVANAIGGILCLYYIWQVRWEKAITEGKQRLDDLQIEGQGFPVQGLREEGV